MTESIKPDLDATIGFLEAFASDGPVNLCAMNADTGRVEGATFKDLGAARTWLAQRVGSMNLYFTANPAPRATGEAGRVRKVDIAEGHHTHVDIDCDKAVDGLTLEQRKDTVLMDLELSEHPPTFVTDSGGGLQPIWKLDAPVTVEQVESINRWLIEKYGGDPGTWNADRLLRLPGTINFPSEKKRERGRVVAPTKLVRSTGELHGVETFGRIDAPSKAEADIVLGAPEEVDIETLGLPERLLTIIRDGEVPGEVKPGDNSASGWLFDGVTNLLRHGVMPEQVLWIILDPDLGISTSVLKRPDADQLRYAEHQVRSALATIEGERRADVKEMGEVDEEWLADDPHPEPSEPTDWEAWFRKNWKPIGQRDITKIRRTPWLTEGLLLCEDVTTIGGRGGSGKSLLTWQIVVATATGKPLAWWPAPAGPRKVLVISGEDDADEIERRVSAACQEMGVERSALGDNFMVWSLRNIRLAMKNEKTGEVTLTDLWKGIRWAVENLGVGLIVTDPLIKVSSGFKENDNDHMEELYGVIRSLTTGYPCAALTVDHFAKSGSAGDQGSFRGGSAKIDASRVAITLTGMTEEEFQKIKPPRSRHSYVLVVDPKQNYAKKSGGHWMEFIDYEVGNGETRPALRWRDLDSVDDFLDPLRWEHRDEFLLMVAEGCVREGKETRPWSASSSGPKEVRLSTGMAQRFDITEKQAGAVIKAFVAEKSIIAEEWKGSNRTSSMVWALNPEFQTEETTEIEAVRES